ncbi:MAG: ribose 1,5-bisphosphate isomerase, partial [Candidatus Helarchaeota archaeon]
KFNPRSYFGKQIKIEEKSPDEILPEIILGVEPKNYYFDVTPAKYISKIISELGIYTPTRFVNEIIKKLPLDWFEKYLKD